MHVGKTFPYYPTAPRYSDCQVRTVSLPSISDPAKLSRDISVRRHVWFGADNNIRQNFRSTTSRFGVDKKFREHLRSTKPRLRPDKIFDGISVRQHVARQCRHVAPGLDSTKKCCIMFWAFRIGFGWVSACIFCAGHFVEHFVRHLVGHHAGSLGLGWICRLGRVPA